MLVVGAGCLGAAGLIASAFAIVASAGTAASTAKPENDKRPTISGTAQEGKTLTGDKGTWKNDPTDFDYSWTRCKPNGNDCSTIKHATAQQYTVASKDVGSTLRFVVVAKNSDGKTQAQSDATDVVKPASTTTTSTTTSTTKSRGKGCPSGSGNPDQVGNLSSPVQLIVDSLQSDPRVVGFSTQSVVVRFHVTSTCGGSVQGALVYATAIPFNQFSVPAEVATGSDGWAALTFDRRSGFPASRKQSLIAFFVRARKPGDSALGGIAARRLVSVRVNRAG